MSYAVKARLGRTVWFDNALDSLELTWHNRWKAYEAWTDAFGYRIKLDKYGWPCRVIFPNEAEAAMFILRWS